MMKAVRFLIPAALFAIIAVFLLRGLDRDPRELGDAVPGELGAASARDQRRVRDARGRRSDDGGDLGDLGGLGGALLRRSCRFRRDTGCLVGLASAGHHREPAIFGRAMLVPVRGTE